MAGSERDIQDLLGQLQDPSMYINRHKKTVAKQVWNYLPDDMREHLRDLCVAGPLRPSMRIPKRKKYVSFSPSYSAFRYLEIYKLAVPIVVRGTFHYYAATKIGAAVWYHSTEDEESNE